MAFDARNPAGMLGQVVTDDTCPPGCVVAQCFCINDGDGKCVACVHVKDGEPCVCLKDKAGNVRHVKLSDILSK